MLSSTAAPGYTRGLPARVFVQQCRFRHQPQHRMIKVQLLADVDHIGKLGTIQTVSPGRMRSILYPQGKATYILRGVAPQLPPLIHPGRASAEEEDISRLDNLQRRIEGLPPIIFRKRIISKRNPAESRSPASPQPIYGSVTVYDIVERLRQNHNLSIALPEVLLSFDTTRYQDRIKTTGLATLYAKLRTGVTIPLKLLVEPEEQ